MSQIVLLITAPTAANVKKSPAHGVSLLDDLQERHACPMVLNASDMASWHLVRPWRHRQL